jgi:diadenosine tetraphosphate (Ap4A) HIT family hydrolase
LNTAMAQPRWPDDWPDRMAGHGCPICATLGQGDNDFSVAVFTGEVAEVYLERRSLLPGYCVVIWKGGHVAEPTDLDPGQASRYWAEVLATGQAVRTRFSPVKMNYLTLGNTVPHLHTHVLPRYLDDPAPGGPIVWQDIFAADPVPDAELHAQAADLRALLAER